MKGNIVMFILICLSGVLALSNFIFYYFMREFKKQQDYWHRKYREEQRCHNQTEKEKRILEKELEEKL